MAMAYDEHDGSIFGAQAASQARVGELRDAAMAGVPMQQTKTTYMTAQTVQYPRDLVRVQDKCLVEADLAGDVFFYSWTVKSKEKNKATGKYEEVDKVVEGITVHGALALLRNFGNCAVEPGQVVDMGDAWLFNPVFVDLETGTSIPRPFRLPKNSNVPGAYDAERKDMMRFQKGWSFAVRNVIEDGTPAYIAKAMVEKAKGKVRERVVFDFENTFKKDMEKMGQATIGRMIGVGCDRKAILARFHVVAPGGLTIDNIVIMQNEFEAIKSGAASPLELYPLPVEEPKPEEKKAETKVEPKPDKPETVKPAETVVEPEREREPGDDDDETVDDDQDDDTETEHADEPEPETPKAPKKSDELAKRLNLKKK
jgi:hypothetical protein